MGYEFMPVLRRFSSVGVYLLAKLGFLWGSLALFSNHREATGATVDFGLFRFLPGVSNAFSLGLNELATTWLLGCDHFVVGLGTPRDGTCKAISVGRI